MFHLCHNDNLGFYFGFWSKSAIAGKLRVNDECRKKVFVNPVKFIIRLVHNETHIKEELNTHKPDEVPS